MLGVALIVVIALVVVKISLWLYRWANPKCSGKLPPGSMGFPLIGETVDFFKPHSFYEIHPFVKKRMSRYGSLFRTSIFGSKTIISTDPEVNYEIFRQENRCFVMSYPEIVDKIFGKDSLFLKQGMEFHKYIRHITLQLLGTECLKRRFMGGINIATQEHLKTDSSGGVLEVKDTTARVINESLRLGTLAPFMFRKAVSDVEIKGYTIPAGWIVVVAPSSVHYDPRIYEKPCEFNPWRWEGKELLSGSKTFMAFGGGARLCAGAEFARLQIAIFIHHLVTKYDFSLIEKPDIIRAIVLGFSKPIRISISLSE